MGFWSRLGGDIATETGRLAVSTRRRFMSLGHGLASIPKHLANSAVKSAIGLKNAVVNSPETMRTTATGFYTRTVSLPVRFKDWFVGLRDVTLKDITRWVINNAILICLLVIIIAIIGSDTTFLTGTNIVAILTQSSTKLIIALGTGVIIVARGTDLSAGRAVGLAALIGSLFSQQVVGSVARDLDPVVVVIISMMVGIGIGMCNGFLVSVYKVDPFIATLSLMLIVYGLNIFFTSEVSGGQSIGNFDSKYFAVSTASFKLGAVDFPYLILISFAVAFLMWIIWTRTPFGRKIFAVGGNPKAAAVSGISVAGVLMLTYMLGGAMYGLGGILDVWRAGSANADFGTLYELDAIAACIVGGLSFQGGRGRISGILLGVLVFQAIQYGFTYIGQPSSMIYVIKGAIIAAAVAFDMVKNRQRV